MKNKCLSILIASFLLLIMVSPCLSLYSYAYTGGVIYSNLPEPYTDDHVKSFVLLPSESAFNNNNVSPLLYVFYDMSYTHQSNITFVVHYYLNSNNYWEWLVDFYDTDNNNTPYTGNFFFAIYNAISGSVYTSRIYSGSSTTITTSYTNSTMPFYQSYGCDYVNGGSGNGASLGSVYWNYQATSSFLNLIKQSVVNIDNDLWEIMSYLDDVLANQNQEITYESQIYNNVYLLRSDQIQYWQSYINLVQYTLLPYIDQVETNQAQIISDINTQCQIIRNQLLSIYNRINDIYLLLGGGQTVTTAPAESELHSNVDEHNSRERQIMGDFDNNLSTLNNVFNSVGNTFNRFNSTFLFIKDVFERFISDYSLLYLLLGFSLTFGLFVTMIGKRVR